MMKKAMIAAGLLVCASTQAANYLQKEFRNAHDHFDYPQLSYWQINNIDHYFADEFFAGQGDILVGIKPALISMMTKYDAPIWLPVETNFTPALFSNLWTTVPSDRYVTGDYTGDGQAEVMAVASNGFIETVHADFSSAGSTWHSLQSGISEIALGDALLSGDFNGDDKDEVLIIQPTHGRAETWSLKKYPMTHGWSSINTQNGGLIASWTINSDDIYTVGDFNGDGKDELLAVNSNSGLYHTMGFVNNQWTMLNNGFGLLGSWITFMPDSKYIAVDFDHDEKDELVAINPYTGWSHISSMSTGLWTHVSDNSGSGFLADRVKIKADDFYLEYNHTLMKLNPDGLVTLLKK